MLFLINPDGGAPIFEQIVAQVIYGVAAGSLEPGTLIPSVRELAERLLVHPNTVARAFQELERAGERRKRPPSTRRQACSRRPRSLRQIATTNLRHYWRNTARVAASIRRR